MTDCIIPDKSRLDLLTEELKALHAIEAWGASLFLSAIALVAKQLVDWTSSSASGAAGQPILQWQMFLLPALVGTTAFIFLRTVNFRIRRVRAHQYALLKSDDYHRWGSFGLVGWLMALMPLAFGFAASFYFGLTRPEMMPTLSLLLNLSGAFVAVALVAFIRQTNMKLSTKR